MAVAGLSFLQASRKERYSTGFKILGKSFSYFGCLTSVEGSISIIPSFFKKEKKFFIELSLREIDLAV
jgi:hypothetical protein